MSDYVAKAESVIKQLSRNEKNEILLNTSQLRKILSAITDVKNKVSVEAAKNKDNIKKISPELQLEIRFLKTILVYQAGREIEKSKEKNNKNNNKKSNYITINAVDEFIEKADLISLLDKIGDDLKRFYRFCKYIEALVAFHKYYSAISQRDKESDTTSMRNSFRGGR
jgi:Protein of unknown function (DUF310).